jgi:transposase
MRRFVEEADRGQWTLLPECLDDFIDESNPVRVIDVFVDALDLAEMSFEGIEPAATGRRSYHPSVLLKLYIYGYLNRVPSSRRLEREAGRNVEVMWLLGRLAPDHKTIADFRRTTAWRRATFVRASSNSAVRWVSSRRRVSPLMAASSRP